MDLNQEVAVPQSDDSGASTEHVAKIKTQTDVLDGDRYKRDMLRFKDEANSLKEKVRELELSEEQKKGNLSSVIESLKEEIRSLKGTNANQKLNFAKTQLDNAIRQQALSKGLDAEKTDVFMRLIDENDKAVVALDEGFNPNMDEVKSLVEKNMERYSSIGLFGKKINVADMTPNNRPPASSPKKDMSQMSAAEMKEYILLNKDKLK